MPSLEDWLDKARVVLSNAGADPVVIGAFAAIRYRVDQRETTDVDFLVRRVEGLRESLESLGLEIEEGKDPSGPPYAYFLKGEVAIDVLISETDIESGRTLDAGYIERWAREWDVSERWQEVRRRSG